MKIIVGTTNPIKIESVRVAFAEVWPHKTFVVSGVSVESGVAAQPMTEEETIRGAQERARNALVTDPDADFGVGLEGGIMAANGEYFTGGWVAIVSRSGTAGLGATLKVVIPPDTMKLVRQGIELGKANDTIFGTTNSKQAGGHAELMSNGLLTRQSEFRAGVISALSRFIHPELF